MMIMRETEDHFIMIEQDKHARLSEEIMKDWISNDLPKSVQTAIALHDYGWKYFDKQPMWNDRMNVPYDFIDFPLAPKLVIYTHGINEVERMDKYAALLCSKHYANFLLQETSPYATQFVNQEKKRQTHLIRQLDDFDKEKFQHHYELLKFADSLSLFLCIHNPTTKKDAFHPFFQNGIRVPTINNNIFPEWNEKETILLHPFPFKSELNLQIEQKVVAKEAIKRNGLVTSYENTPYQKITFFLKST